jgi:hypothetical protein
MHRLLPIKDCSRTRFRRARTAPRTDSLASGVLLISIPGAFPLIHQCHSPFLKRSALSYIKSAPHNDVSAFSPYQYPARCGSMASKQNLRPLASAIHFQRRDKRFLRNLDLAELPHLLFARLLLFQQLAFAGDVAAIAFRGHVLT